MLNLNEIKNNQICLSMYCFDFFKECPCQIITPLCDLERIEKNDVSMVLNISKPRQVVWLKNGNPIVDNERVKQSSNADGLEHTLAISDLSMEENGVITARIVDNEYGWLESSCHLSVKGIFMKYVT